MEREAEGIEAAARELVAVAAELGEPPPCVGRSEVDQINIIARWISHHSDDSDRAFFNLPRALDDDAAVTAFTTRVAATISALEPDTESQPEGDVASDDDDPDPSDD